MLSVADIPLIQSRNIDEIISRTIDHKNYVFAPSIDGGTNIMTQLPPRMIKLMYGEDSFNKHLKQAKLQRLKIFVYEAPESSLDIDTVEDIKTLIEIGCHGYTAKTLETLKDRLPE
jgi:2-phospho-L-lactate guanylyltransferase